MRIIPSLIVFFRKKHVDLTDVYFYFLIFEPYEHVCLEI